MNRRQIAGALVALIAASLLFAVEPAAGPAAGAPEGGGTGSSSVTTHGTKQGFEDFTGLAVTVSKTRDLSNEAIVVSWTGARPTPRRMLGVDYLQLMQCWGDPAAANFRETCQFGMDLDRPFLPGGAVSVDAVNSGRRALITTPPDPDYPVPDPQEPLEGARMVPFLSVTGERSKDGSPAQPYGRIELSGGTSREETDVDVMGRYAAKETTNEYPYALTGGDGTGRVVFEVQNDQFAPHLGCGAAVATPTGTGPRPCSLVIVPRGFHHPYTGADVSGTSAIHGSPFAPAVWQHRIVVPLEFNPVEGSCPLDRSERRTAGTEVIAEAITSWQPAICSGEGPVIGYSAIGDFEATFQVTNPAENAPGLVYSPEPVTATSPAYLHAPVAVSGTVVALNIDYNIIDPQHVSGEPTPEEIERLRALAVSGLKLTPRLMAKLLTQSYRRDAMGPVGQAGRANPASIRVDNEFLTLNPEFRYWPREEAATLDGLMVTVGSSTAARDLWRWILADPEAKAWLDGTPDEDGMVVNENYRGVFTPTPETFPKADPRCVANLGGDGVEYQLCGLERFPYMGTMAEAALQTLRANAKVKETLLRPQPGEVAPWLDDPQYRYLELPRKTPGARFAMSVTDSSAAARYGLYAAQLCKPKRDTSGALVMPDDCRSPSTAAMSAALATASASGVEGVDVIDPAKAWAAPGAYPLTTITYAIGDTSDPADARRDYARLLRYAAGPGQAPGQADGQLPDGYLPLPAAMRERTLDTADRLERWVTPTTPTPSEGNGNGNGGPTTPAPSATSAGVPDPGATPSASGPAAPPTPQPSATPAAQSTIGSPLGIIRYILIAALVMGLLGGVAGPVLQALARGGRK
ncbi:hypothetical protein [Phytohabitans kaempferiae]|uniref:PBP domain-containing protein n=1 Tax=Phytohabitans kaempferiae TaxID=1620943 RepID=A0ABV6MCW0_9ACTN